MVGLACRDFRLGLRDSGLVFRDWGFGLEIGVKRFGFVFFGLGRMSRSFEV